MGKESKMDRESKMNRDSKNGQGVQKMMGKHLKIYIFNACFDFIFCVV